MSTGPPPAADTMSASQRMGLAVAPTPILPTSALIFQLQPWVTATNSPRFFAATFGYEQRILPGEFVGRVHAPCASHSPTVIPHRLTRRA